MGFNSAFKGLMAAELFHADRRTDITELIVAFRNFAKAPKIKPKSIMCAGNKQSFTN